MSKQSNLIVGVVVAGIIGVVAIVFYLYYMSIQSAPSTTMDSNSSFGNSSATQYAYMGANGSTTNSTTLPYFKDTYTKKFYWG